MRQHLQLTTLINQIQPSRVGFERCLRLLNGTAQDFFQIQGAVHDFGNRVEGLQIGVLLLNFVFGLHHRRQEHFQIIFARLRDG